MTDTNESLFARGQRVIPGGVNSPVRAFRSVGGTPYFVARGDGARVTDVEGRTFIDLVQSYGAVIAGHAHPRLVEAICAAAADGTSFGAPTPREVLLAEAIAERVPSCEKVRMVNSGTEATMSVIRVARGATGRSKLLKFAGKLCVRLYPVLSLLVPTVTAPLDTLSCAVPVPLVMIAPADPLATLGSDVSPARTASYGSRSRRGITTSVSAALVAPEIDISNDLAELTLYRASAIWIS
jgi:hypothetical protein